MHCNYDSFRPIILQFPRFAGGKFISNCLSLSRHAAPQHSAAAEYLLQNPTDYEYRYNTIIKTLPPNKLAMRRWIDHYEFGDGQLYSTAHAKWLQGIQAQVNDITVKLSNGPLHFFLVTHTHSARLLKVWPNANVIVLINHRSFSEISRLWKSNGEQTLQDIAGNYCIEKYNMLMGNEWPSWKKFESTGFDVEQFKDQCSPHIVNEIEKYYPRYNTKQKVLTFDIDSNIFDKDAFLCAMKNLYLKLQFDDFSSELCEKFWKKYIQLHT